MRPRSDSDVPCDVSEIIDGVLSELIRAQNDYPAFHSPHEGYAVLLEEVHEVWDAVRKDDVKHARREAVQVAAMAIRFIRDLG